MGERATARVLYAGGGGERARRLAGEIERAGDLSVRTATDVAATVEQLAGREFDCLLLDADLPGAAPVEIVETVRERHPDLPIVQVAPDEAVATAALEAGATDAVGAGAADRPDLLARRIEVAVERAGTDEGFLEDREQQAEFARLVAHDLRNPLAVARGWLDLLNETGEPEHYRKAVSALDRIDGIIDNLETLAGGVTDVEGADQRVELSAVATAAWELVEAPRSDLRVEYGHDLRADPSLLQQALENLFSNAVEHGQDGDAGGGPDGVTVRVGARPEEGVLYVADDGRGIPEGERERIFEAGYSGDGGTGFGLAIVERVAAAHGWTVGVRESEGGGARFEFGDVEFLDREGGDGDPPEVPSGPADDGDAAAGTDRDGVEDGGAVGDADREAGEDGNGEPSGGRPTGAGGAGPSGSPTDGPPGETDGPPDDADSRPAARGRHGDAADSDDHPE